MKALLVLNAGSSTIKFAVFDAADTSASAARGIVDGLNGKTRLRASLAAGERVDAEIGEVSPERSEALAAILRLVDESFGPDSLFAAGHRVVHGGVEFAQPVVVDAGVLRSLDELTPLAPLHQPHNLAGIRLLGRLRPDLPQVACFDTAFHRTQDRRAETMPLPRALTDAGVRRYGFHGLSYEYIAGVLSGHLGERAGGRVIVAHLGAGSSLCAMRERRSVATSMGFTALDGLMMATRPGSIDPGVILYLLDRGYDSAGIQRMLYHECGLLGVSGISGDMRTLLASAEPRARDAVELFCYRAARDIASLAAAVEGLDAIVFTGGIGENAAPVRARIVELCRWLGAELDEAANAAGGPRISAAGSSIEVLAIPTDEEAMIARHTLSRLAEP